ncbi:MAG: UDP-N-acetylglucosamine pyrophosphorylase, partial [Firmicutes bacterium]|nr:UDP-N-acetylglucosamine pyrophosphorylase [Bacillota bacterium]
EQMETGRRKFGAMLGDWCEIGCNAVLNPGSVVGRNATVYPTTCSRGVVPANSIKKNDGRIVEKRTE